MTSVPRALRTPLLALLAVLASATAAAPAAHASSAEWKALAAQMAAPWPNLAKGDGELIDYMDEYTNPGGKPGGTRYGDALMGYALIQAGLREKNNAMIDTGIRSISWATDPNRYFAPETRSDDSVFEQWGVSAAYNLARVRLDGDSGFEKHRERWEVWLRKQKTVRFGTGRRFSNHDLVEAVMAQEILRSGLSSSDPNAIVGGARARVEKQILDLVNTQAPAVVGRRNPAFLSDPPDMPAAYHALSFGLYSHLVSRLGTKANLNARIVVRRSADGSWRMAAPDADQAIWGRSQELVWAYPAAAYGASIAAGLPDTSAADAARYRELINRSLGRLRSDYPVTEKGQLVAPGLASPDRISVAHLLEGYVGAPSMGGLALVFLNQALDEPGASLDGPTGRLAADVDTEAVIGDNEASFGVARRGNLWFAVRASRIRQGRLGTDVRYDLGVVGLKRFENGAWRDLVIHRPNTMGQDSRDSIGPVRVSGTTLYPAAPSTVEPTSTGGFLLRGGWWLNNRNRGIQRKATFRYEPTGCGVAQTFPGKPGEVYEQSFFFRDHPVKSGRSLVGPRETVTSSVPFSLRIHSNNHRSRPYASAMHGPLFRARVRVRVPKSGRVTLTSC